MRRRDFLCTIGPALAGAASAMSAPCAPGTAPLAALAAFELAPCFRALVIRRRPASPIGADGATRHNIGTTREWQDQAAGLGWIRYGRLYRDPSAVAAGWRAFDWGLTTAATAGWASSIDAVHQTTWFLEAMACAMALDPAGATAGRQVGLRAGIAWLEEPERRAHAEANSRTFTHRCWMRASLFRSAGAIFGDDRLARRSGANVLQGLGQQRGDGAFPERGGEDVGYQILGLQYLQRWLAMRASDPLGTRVLAAQDAALGWYLAHVGAGGEIDRAGSTRMRVEKGKDVRYARAIEVLLGASLLTGSPKWVRAAALLDRGAVAEGQAPTTDLTLFGAPPAGGPSAAIVGECTLCAR